MKIPVNFQQHVIFTLALFLIILVGFDGKEPGAQQKSTPEKKPVAQAQAVKKTAHRVSMMENVTCEMCHGTLEEVAANTTASYPPGVKTAAAKEACKYEPFAINPHKSHYGEMKCTQCHKNGKTTLYCNTCHGFRIKPQSTMVTVSDKSCHECHGTLDKMAEVITEIFPPFVKTEIQKSCTRWEPFPVNPHKSHYGEMKCTQCHKIHGNSRLYCNTCHGFQNIDVP